MPLPSIAALLTLLITAVFLVALIAIQLRSSKLRREHGLGRGRTIALDDTLLVSRRYGLSGRPDRLVQRGRMIIPEEWKSGTEVWPSHRAQLAVYFLIVEDHYGVRPTHGYIVCGDGARHRVENTEKMRSWVLQQAERIRMARANLAVAIHVDPTPEQCAACGVRIHCGQARSQ
jgi:CRISPR-associated exonuclease Cas4